MFLLKSLNYAEQNYRTTKLEVAGLVWTVRRIRYLIKTIYKIPVIIYTDHVSAIGVIAKDCLKFSNIDR